MVGSEIFVVGNILNSIKKTKINQHATTQMG